MLEIYVFEFIGKYLKYIRLLFRDPKSIESISRRILF